MKKKLHALLLLLISITGFSQTLDPTFGSGGKVLTHIGDDQDAMTSVAVLPNGKIIGAGLSKEGDGIFRTVICRYDSDGTLDTSFGTNGKVVFNSLFHEAINCKIKLQPDGKILIATNVGIEWWEYDFLLVRLNEDGSYDANFGTNGIVTTDFEASAFGNSQNSLRAIELQSDGKIILGGESGDLGQFENFAIARYNSNGSLDTAFGNNGKISMNIGSNSTSTYSIDGIYGIKLQSNGKIILAGYSDAQNSIEVYNAALVRLNTDGTIDTTFGTNGKTITNIPFCSVGISSLVINSDDTIIAGEIVNFNSNGNTKVGVMKYDANGNLNTAFGVNGHALTQVNTTEMRDTIWDMALQPDGKIVAVGYSLNSTIDMVLLRYDTGGNLDSTFDNDGILLTDFGSAADGAYSLLMQPDGKIVVGGLSGINPNYEFALARYTFEDLNIANTTDNSFIIYPNPTAGVLNIQNLRNIAIQNIKITDLTGKKIIEQQGASQINIENLTKGIYFLELDYEGGKQIEKFIKQ